MPFCKVNKRFPDINISGYLFKKPDKGVVRTWKKRWFVLQQGNADDRSAIGIYSNLKEFSTYCMIMRPNIRRLQSIGFASGLNPERGVEWVRDCVSGIRLMPSVELGFSIDVPGRSYILKAPSEKELNMVHRSSQTKVNATNSI